MGRSAGDTQRRHKAKLSHKQEIEGGLVVGGRDGGRVLTREGNERQHMTWVESVAESGSSRHSVVKETEN